MARASQSENSGARLGQLESRRAVARHAAEGAVHRNADPRSRPRHPRRAVQWARSDQRASTEGHGRRPEEARENRCLQHARDGERRADVRLGMHHRAG